MDSVLGHGVWATPERWPHVISCSHMQLLSIILLFSLLDPLQISEKAIESVSLGKPSKVIKSNQ